MEWIIYFPASLDSVIEEDFFEERVFTSASLVSLGLPPFLLDFGQVARKEEERKRWDEICAKEKRGRR